MEIYRKKKHMDRKSIVQLSRIRHATTKEQVLHLLDAALITALPALPGNAEQGDEDPFDEQKSTHLWIVSRAAALLKDESKAGRHIEARRHSWPEAMKCLVQGYGEIAKVSRTLLKDLIPTGNVS